MSLDIWFKEDRKLKELGTGLYVKDNGVRKEVTYDELLKYLPNLDIGEDGISSEELFSANITHNLSTMAAEAGIRDVVWGYRDGCTRAKHIIEDLEKGLKDMKERPEHYKKYDAPNGWGTYKDFIPWLEKLLQAAKDYPDSKVYWSR